MATADVVLFLHIMSVVAGMMLAAVLHESLFRCRSARTLGELKAWPAVIHRVEPILPLMALAAFGTGLWLIALSDGEFRVGDPWVVWSIVGLVTAELIGAAMVPRSKALQRRIVEAPDEGQVPPELRPEATIWLAGHTATALFVGVVFLMVVKPSGPTSAVVLVVAAAIGLASALPFLKPVALSAPARTV